MQVALRPFGGGSGNIRGAMGIAASQGFDSPADAGIDRGRMIESGEDVVRRLRARADEIEAEVRILRQQG